MHAGLQTVAYVCVWTKVLSGRMSDRLSSISFLGLCREAQRGTVKQVTIDSIGQFCRCRRSKQKCGNMYTLSSITRIPCQMQLSTYMNLEQELHRLDYGSLSLQLL